MNNPHSDRLRRPDLAVAPERVVSLVPSLTETICDLGFGARLVGRTDYCIFPAERMKTIPSIGGPKNASVESIAALRPDLVLANAEENTPEIVEQLEAKGIPVWVGFPRTVRDSVLDLWNLAGYFRNDQALQSIRGLEEALELAELVSADLPKFRYFCPIWQDSLADGTPWWMTFNRHTYPSDLLELFGGINIFADRERRYPLEADLGEGLAESAGERDTRYPRVTCEEILAGDPDFILLPDEPFRYTAEYIPQLNELFSSTQAVTWDNIRLIDGTLLMWYGTRLGKALTELGRIFD